MAEFTLRSGETIEVEDDLLPRLQEQAWTVGSNGMVRRSVWDKEEKRVRTEQLSSVVTGQPAPKGKVWIHADGNWKNFRRDNLVLVERGKHHDRAFGAMGSQALQEVIAHARGSKANRVGFRGVHRVGNKFRAMTTVAGKQTYLGLFESAEEAARAYDQALVKQGLKPVNFPK